MIYFVEHDSAGNIVHACCDPEATIVPLINRVVFNDATGHPLKDSDGADLSPYGFKLIDPVGVDAATYTALIADGLDSYMCGPTTQIITKRAA